MHLKCAPSDIQKTMETVTKSPTTHAVGGHSMSSQETDRSGL